MASAWFGPFVYMLSCICHMGALQALFSIGGWPNSEAFSSAAFISSGAVGLLSLLR